MTTRNTADPFAIPELTRGLRSFAAPGALGGAHDRYFMPLLDARRSANAALRWPLRLAAFDADRMEAAMRATLEAFAAERFPSSAPDRRGLTARLEDACGDFFDALEALAAESVRVRDAVDDDARADGWPAWTVALHDVFAAADRGWEHVRLLLGEA